MRECSPPQMCHMSHVTCHISCVMCHVSCVTFHVSRVICHMSHVTCHIFYFIFFFGQSGEAYRWRVCYQRGLPRLVFWLNWPQRINIFILYEGRENYKITKMLIIKLPMAIIIVAIMASKWPFWPKWPFLQWPYWT